MKLIFIFFVLHGIFISFRDIDAVSTRNIYGCHTAYLRCKWCFSSDVCVRASASWHLRDPGLWNRRNELGESVASEVYFYTLLGHT